MMSRLVVCMGLETPQLEEEWERLWGEKNTSKQCIPERMVGPYVWKCQ